MELSGPNISGAKMCNTVDLFCGCGGLSLGFDVFDGPVQFRTVLALDNEPKAVAVFNRNFSLLGHGLSSAKVCDLTWFAHPSEVLHYYLHHFASSVNDRELRRGLDEQVNARGFFATLAQIDRDFAQNCASLVASEHYQQALDECEAGTFSLALVRALFIRLGLILPRKRAFGPGAALWAAEAAPLADADVQRIDFNTNREICQAVGSLWRRELDSLRAAGQKNGRGQHTPVAQRVQQLTRFLDGPTGQQIYGLWADWRARRDSLRATFAVKSAKTLEALYTPARRVDLILGGPPCKGFSRIGRPVIASLRDQGVHAWVDTAYGDSRNALLHSYVLFLRALRPAAFLFENVRQFEASLKTPTARFNGADELHNAIAQLTDDELHYEVSARVIHASEHAIPQDRQRFILIGCDQDRSPPGTSKRCLDIESYEGIA